jgi:predicted nuclease of restriction endonuclease-like RecB superfamily
MNLKQQPKNESEHLEATSSKGFESVLKMTEKYGVSLVLLLVVGYGGFNYVLLPIASRFADSIDKVSAVNEDLRDKIASIGVENGKALNAVIQEINEIKQTVSQLERYFLAKSAKESPEPVQYPVQQYSQRRRWRR